MYTTVMYCEDYTFRNLASERIIIVNLTHCVTHQSCDAHGTCGLSPDKDRMFCPKDLEWTLTWLNGEEV